MGFAGRMRINQDTLASEFGQLLRIALKYIKTAWQIRGPWRYFAKAGEIANKVLLISK